MGTNTHTRVKETVQRYLSSFERFQEELLSLKVLRLRVNLPLELLIGLSETDDLMEAIRKYKSELKKGQARTLYIEIVFYQYVAKRIKNIEAAMIYYHYNFEDICGANNRSTSNYYGIDVKI